MDEYSKSGPKSGKSEALARVRETIRQMRALAHIRDEQTLREMLLRDHEIDENHPRFKQILQTWRELQRRS